MTHDSVGDLERHFSGQVEVAARLGVPLVVVDTASTDGTLDLVRREAARSPSVSLAELPRNPGYATAVNRAFAAARGRHVLLLNPDVELRDEAPVKALAEFLAGHPHVGIVAPRLHHPDGTPQPSARRFPSLLALIGSLRAARWLAPAKRSYARYLAPSTATEARTVDWVLGAAMLIRREAFDAVGGWDERFFLYMEDADFCRRCAAAGWEVVYVPGVVIQHDYRRASSTAHASVFSSVARRRHIVSLARFYSRYPGLIFGRG